MVEVENCKYRLSCNWCDKFNKFCDMSKPIEITILDPNKCDHDWRHEDSYINTETGECKHKYTCRKCHELRMVYNETELND